VNVLEAFAYLESFTNLEKKTSLSEREYRLDRMRFLLSAFGNPERAFKSIHIAGSKGKGSTAICAASMLAAAGFKTGLYTSPHVVSYKERITLAGKEFPDEAYVAGIERIRSFVESMNESDYPGGSGPTTFELLTLLGFLMFASAGCQWAVIETGIGGRLDATNLVQPEVCVLTPIELEHTDILGHTIEAIAREKAGIMKPHIPAFSAVQRPEARRIFRERSDELKVPLFFLDESIVSLDMRLSEKGTEMHLLLSDGDTLDAHLPLLGRFQGENASLAYLAVREALRIAHTELKKTDAVKGLASAQLPGRTELIRSRGGVPCIIDGAHTPVSVQRVLETVQEVFGRGGVLIFGAVAGKDIKGMASILSPAFDRILISTPGHFKESRPEEVYAIFKSANPHTEYHPDPKDALKRGLSLTNGGPLLVTGSFYMASEVRKLILAEESIS